MASLRTRRKPDSVAPRGRTGGRPGSGSTPKSVTPLKGRERQLVEPAVRAIADRIASRAINPGNRISEQEICDEFQMSRSTAREVLTALAHRGLVVRPPNRSATVTRFTAEEVYETFNIREVLEGLCFRLAVENEPPESWQDLVDLYGAPMQDIIGRGDHSAQLKTIDYLIQRVRAASGNRTPVRHAREHRRAQPLHHLPDADPARTPGDRPGRSARGDRRHAARRCRRNRAAAAGEHPRPEGFFSPAPGPDPELTRRMSAWPSWWPWTPRMEVRMRGRTPIIGLEAAASLAAGCLPVLLAARNEPTASPARPGISAAEHRQTIKALKPPKRQRPGIAILALNEGTEVSDLLTSYGVLSQSGVGDVTVVAERRSRSCSIRAPGRHAGHHGWFDASIPRAPISSSSPQWSRATSRRDRLAQGAAPAGTEDRFDVRRRADAVGRGPAGRTPGHRPLALHPAAPAKNPTMQWVRDRRYVVDRGVATSTGITASVPLMMALVEAIGGGTGVERLVKRVGAADWDAGHDTAAFQLTFEQRNTYVRDTEALAARNHRHQGDEGRRDCLRLMVDAYSRTELTRAITVGTDGGFLESRRGLRIRSDGSAEAARL